MEPRETKKKVLENRSIENDERLISREIDMFKHMGYSERLSDKAVVILRAFKKRKDLLHPGPMTAEAFAFVAVLADMADGTLDLSIKEEDSNED
ncbi:MAG: hypothetical protein R6V06_00080 [Kiritimatiellia bacterium]